MAQPDVGTVEALVVSSVPHLRALQRVFKLLAAEERLAEPDGRDESPPMVPVVADCQCGHR